MGRKKIKVAVLFGGQSAEHDISVRSAETILENLSSRYEVLPIRIDENGRWFLQKKISSNGEGVHVVPGPSGNSTLVSISTHSFSHTIPDAPIDVVFPVLHGPMGEDGTVQGFLELAHLPYVGCGVLASAVGMDKEVAKRLATQVEIPVLPHVLLRSESDLRTMKGAIKKLGFPLFVKPVRLGSSVGITKVKEAKEIAPAVKLAFQYDTKVMIEKGVGAQEICVGVLGEPGQTQVSVCGEVEVKEGHEFFDYKAKYVDEKGHELHIPARLSPVEAKKITDLARLAFETFEGNGMARVDFLVEKKKRKIYFGEINTIPGFTSHSLYPQLWKASGVSLPQLLDRLIELALKRHQQHSRLKTAP
ncbi:MAG: D-alanine--D-alanine ligase [Elusimicrobia bacterium]|nr:D-alanine--D-alanine ligase [Elusimicrobiota bacterium]